MLRLRLLLALGLLLPACSAAPEPLLDRPVAFPAGEVTWAQGRTLHVGDRVFEVPGRVLQLWPSPYGVLLELQTAPDAYDVVLFDGQTSTSLRGAPRDVRVSPDGRHAGWIDREGEQRDTGRAAEAVVVDLRTGAEVVRSDSGMGADSGDVSDLYEEVFFGFLGFDDEHAYWSVPDGKVKQRRAVLATGDVEEAARTVGPYDDEGPAGTPSDRARGTEVVVGDDGRAAGQRDGYVGLRSPDGRWCVTDRGDGLLPATDCATGQEVTPRYPAPFVLFGGWLDGDSHLVLARTDREGPPSFGVVDDSRGTLAVCDLPSGGCRTVQQVRGTTTVALPGGRPVEVPQPPLVD